MASGGGGEQQVVAYVGGTGARGRSASGGGAVCARRWLRMSEGAAARGVLVMACTGGGKV